MGPNFDTEITRSKDAIIVAVIGELERVTFIDAHGLRLLVLHARSREHGQRVAMRSLSFPVQRMLALTGVDVS